MIRNTPCECDAPGWCARHRIEKTRLLWLACQRDPGLFDYWDGQANEEGTTSASLPNAALPRCKHRGEEAVDSVRCELCGAREIFVEVYTCTLHDRCTERRFGNSTDLSRTIAACTTCSDYAPSEEVSVVGTS